MSYSIYYMNIYFRRLALRVGSTRLLFLALLFVSMIWGTSFLVIKHILQSISPFSYLFQRFGLAFFILLLLNLKELPRPQYLFRKEGILLGCILALDYSLSTWGVRYTTASNATLISNMFVLLTPLLELAIYKKKLKAKYIVGSLLALMGFIIITNITSLSLNIGDVLVLCATVLFSIHLILAERFRKYCEAKPLILSELLMVTIVSFFLGIFDGGIQLIPTPDLLLSIFYLSIFATIVAYEVILQAEEKISPEHTASILSLQGVFAVILTVFLSIEPLSLQKVLGTICITGALYVIEQKKRRHHQH